MTTTAELVARLGQRLDEETTAIPHGLDTLDKYYRGRQPLAFLSAKAREQIGDRLTTLAANVPRLVCDTIAERVAVEGFRVGGPDEERDAALWALWRGLGMEDGSAQAVVDSLTFGRSPVSVWVAVDGSPRVRVESPRQTAVQIDPATGERTAALKRLVDVEAKRLRAVLFEPDKVTRLAHPSQVIDPAAMPLDGWTVEQTLPNPLGVVPVVLCLNRPTVTRPQGESEMLDVLGLTDALGKVLVDMMVTSEHYARPRRWASGLEVPLDEEDQPVNPFDDDALRTWIAEDPAARFGQFDAASLGSYRDAVQVLTQQIQSVTSLPPSALGIHGDQPSSADAIRASEAGLVARARTKQRVLGPAFAEILRLAVMIRDGREDPRLDDVEVLWSDPETRTEAASVDAAAKLVGIGVPLAAALDRIGYTPQQVRTILDMRRAAALDAALTDLGRLP